MIRQTLALLLAGMAARAAVVVHESDTAITASNACIAFTLGIAGSGAGNMTSLKWKGAELLGHGGRGYAIVVDSVGVSWSIGRTAFDHSVRRGPDFVDVAVIHRSEEAIPFEFELHYLLRSDECGFHEYSIHRFTGNAAHPSDTIAQFVTTLRTDPNIFRYHSADLYQTGIMPLPEHLAGSGDLQDATYNLLPFPGDPYLANDWNYTKYNFSSFEKNHVLHGVYGGGYGIWCIHTPLSKESWNGGPTKQNLTIHQTATTPVLLNEYFNAHYGQASTALQVQAGWTRTYGPWFFYVNHGDTSNSAGYLALWSDAAHYGGSYHRSFYDTAEIPGYLPSKLRATVTGKIKLSTGDSTAGATVVLSDNGVPFDRSLAGYQYWTDAAADGAFSIPEVRPGTYRLSAYRTGVLDDFHLDDVVVSAPSTRVADQVWTPPGGGTTVLQIGIPDRTAMEFKDGDRYKHYGLFNDEAKYLPDGVRYVFGAVDGMLPTSDRDGWFFTQWRRYNENYRDGRYIPAGRRTEPPDFQAFFTLRHVPADGSSVNLTVAIASGLSAGVLTASLNGNAPKTWTVTAGASSATRSGAAGTYSSTVLRFPAAHLRTGTNVLTLRFDPNAIQYDAIRLQIEPADPTLAAQPDLTVSASHTGAFRAGGAVAYRIVVKNVSADPTTGPVTMAFSIPWPLAAAPMELSGKGWACDGAGHVVVDGLGYECSRRDTLAGGASFPPIDARGRLLPDSAASVLTVATVSGGGDGNTINNVACDAAPVAPAVRRR